jgi:L-threonylcarbamoyladenylate synthase
MTTATIVKAVQILLAGGLVAVPTETVYGLGADAGNEAAVRRIFLAKERPYDHPLIVHIAETRQLTDWARNVSPAALQLAHAFWPGPLTMVLKKQPQVLDRVTGGQDTVGLRIPSHPIAQALLKAFGRGVAAPSANNFTHISPTTAEAVQEELGDSVDLILDGGDCTVGLESTIIDMSRDTPVILRPGMISAEAIARVLGVRVTTARQDTAVTRTPGMHHLHYAPITKTTLLDANAISSLVASLRDNDVPMVVVMHSPAPVATSNDIHRVQMPDEAVNYAHELYRTLRRLDNQHYKCIIIEAVPDTTAWDAIRDRLSKASGRK